MPQATQEINAAKILDTGFAFFGSRVLLTAVELEVFTLLGKGPLTGEALGQKLGLHPRGIADFFDTLVAMGFLLRDGNGARAIYRNTPETARFLDKDKPDYIGGILEMASARLFRFWNDLPEALKTGQPQNEIKHNKRPMFAELYADPARLEQFMRAMSGISRGNFQALAEKYDFSKHETLCDVGGATGILSVIVAERFPHLQCFTFDLPEVEPIAQRTITKFGLTDRIKTVSGDFFRDPLPTADVITMGLILHDWNLPDKQKLIEAAYRALRPGGALIAVENLIDDDRRENAFGLLMSLNMLIEFGDAFDFTFAEYQQWCTNAGFRSFELLHLAGPCSAAIAYK